MAVEFLPGAPGGILAKGKAGCAQSGGDIFVRVGAYACGPAGQSQLGKRENQATDCLSFLSVIWAE